MAETFANLKGIQEVAQQLTNTFATRRYSTAKGGLTLFEERRNDSSQVFVKPENLTGMEQVFRSLERAKAEAEQSPSIEESGIDADIATIIKNLSGANGVMADVGSFLAKLASLYERNERKLTDRLDSTMTSMDPERVRYLNPVAKPGRAAPQKEGFMSFRNPIVWGKNGQYGLDLCLLEFEDYQRDADGVTHDSEKLLCLTLKAGVGNQTSDGDRAIGIDGGFNFWSVEGGRVSDGPISAEYNVGNGKGPSFTMMVVEHADGTMDTNFGIPGTPIGGTFHEKSTFKDLGRFLSHTPQVMWAF